MWPQCHRINERPEQKILLDRNIVNSFMSLNSLIKREIKLARCMFNNHLIYLVIKFFVCCLRLGYFNFLTFTLFLCIDLFDLFCDSHGYWWCHVLRIGQLYGNMATTYRIVLLAWLWQPAWICGGCRVSIWLSRDTITIVSCGPVLVLLHAIVPLE